MDYSIQNNEQLSERYSWPVGAGDPDSDAPRLLVSDERFHYVNINSESEFKDYSTAICDENQHISRGPSHEHYVLH